MHKQTVTSLRVQLLERYERGRGNDKKVDEYSLGEITLERIIHIPSDTPIEIEFELAFESLDSEVDTFAQRNRLFRGLANLAKRAYKAESTYYVVAEANVKGTALNPFMKQGIELS